MELESHGEEVYVKEVCVCECLCVSVCLVRVYEGVYVWTILKS